MQTYGKPVFFGFLRLRSDAPLFQKVPTTEIEYPWRYCPKSIIITLRFPLWICGLVLGKWKDNDRPWNETVLEILKGRELEKETTTGTPENVPEDRENLG